MTRDEQIEKLNELMDELAGIEDEGDRFASVCYRPDPDEDIYFDEDEEVEKTIDIEEGFWVVPFEARHFNDEGDYLGRTYKEAKAALERYVLDC